MELVIIYRGGGGKREGLTGVLIGSGCGGHSFSVTRRGGELSFVEVL